MTGDQLRNELIDLDLTQIRFAEFVGVDQRTVRAWIGELYPVPRYAEIILDYLERDDIDHIIKRLEKRKRR